MFEEIFIDELQLLQIYNSNYNIILNLLVTSHSIIIEAQIKFKLLSEDKIIPIREGINIIIPSRTKLKGKGWFVSVRLWESEILLEIQEGDKAVSLYRRIARLLSLIPSVLSLNGRLTKDGPKIKNIPPDTILKIKINVEIFLFYKFLKIQTLMNIIM
jgi:hypothetical protein